MQFKEIKMHKTIKIREKEMNIWFGNLSKDRKYQKSTDERQVRPDYFKTKVAVFSNQAAQHKQAS